MHPIHFLFYTWAFQPITRYHPSLYHSNSATGRPLSDEMFAINGRYEKYPTPSARLHASHRSIHMHTSMHNIHHCYLIAVHDCTMCATNICAMKGDCVLLVLEGDWFDVDCKAPVIPKVYQGPPLSIEYLLLHFNWFHLCNHYRWWVMLRNYVIFSFV